MLPADNNNAEASCLTGSGSVIPDEDNNGTTDTFAGR
jgi:hypothetical protein